MRSLGDIAKIRTFSRFEKMAGKLILHVISSVEEQIVSKCKKITLIVCLSCFCSKNMYIKTHVRYECGFLK